MQKKRTDATTRVSPSLTKQSESNDASIAATIVKNHNKWQQLNGASRTPVPCRCMSSCSTTEGGTRRARRWTRYWDTTRAAPLCINRPRQWAWPKPS